MKKIKTYLISALASTMMFMNFAVMNAHAEGDVAGAVTNTWNSAKS